jgi:hypothetical protein
VPEPTALREQRPRGHRVVERDQESIMNSWKIFSRQGQPLLQIGVALLLFLSFEGFAIPYLAAPHLGLSVHKLSGLQSVLLLALGLVWPRLNLGAVHHGSRFGS